MHDPMGGVCVGWGHSSGLPWWYSGLRQALPRDKARYFLRHHGAPRTEKEVRTNRGLFINVLPFTCPPTVP